MPPLPGWWNRRSWRKTSAVGASACVLTKLSTLFILTLIQLSEKGMDQIVWSSRNRSRSFVASWILLSFTRDCNGRWEQSFLWVNSTMSNSVNKKHLNPKNSWFLFLLCLKYFNEWFDKVYFRYWAIQIIKLVPQEIQEFQRRYINLPQCGKQKHLF